MSHTGSVVQLPTPGAKMVVYRWRLPHPLAMWHAELRLPWSINHHGERWPINRVEVHAWTRKRLEKKIAWWASKFPSETAENGPGWQAAGPMIDAKELLNEVPDMRFRGRPPGCGRCEGGLLKYTFLGVEHGALCDCAAGDWWREQAEQERV